MWIKAVPGPVPDNTMIHPRSVSGEKETFDGSFHANRFSVRGSYDLDLWYCYNISKATSRRRRETQDNKVKGYVQSTLTAHDNQSKQ